MSQPETRKSYEWIQAQSGRTYLCPAGSIDSEGHVSEDELRRFCVDESENPHND